MSGKRRKKHTGLKIFLVIVVVLVAGVFLLKDQIISAVKDKAAEVVVEKLIDEKLNDDSLSYNGVSAKDIIDSMDEADKETITSVITNNMTEENISAVESYVKSGDTAGLKDYVKENLSETDKATVTDLYEKYKDQIPTDQIPVDQLPQ